MSTSTYYNFMTTTTTGTPTTMAADETAPPQNSHNRMAAAAATSSLEAARRRSAMSSPFANSSFSSSSNTSSSSLNQFNSLAQTSSITTSSSGSSSGGSSSCYGNAGQRGQLSPLSNCSFSSVSSSTSTSTPPATTATNHLSNSHLQLQRHQQQLQSQSQKQYQQPRDLLQRKSSISPAMSIPHQASPQPHHHSATQMFHSYTLHSLEPKPFKPFKTKSDYIEAMKEDLAEWLNQLYPDLDLSPENLFSQLETGAIICRHANNVTLMGRNLIQDTSHNSLNESSYGSITNEPNNNNQHHHRANSNSPMSSASSNDFSLCSSSSNSKSINTQHISPRQSITSLSSRAVNDINWFWVKIIPYKEKAKPGTFFARDNICQFILWCRSLNILECLLFETDDLVARKNEKSFILCLLEVARIGFKVGMPTPLIIQLEQEIDREIEEEAKLEAEKQNQFTSHLDEESCSDSDESSSRKTSDDEHEEACAMRTEEQPLQQQQLDIEKKLETSLHGEPTVKQSEKEEETEEEREEEDYGPKPQVITNDLVSLHEKVVQLLCQCTCPTQFPMVRVGDNGKYKIGDKLIIFVRILRRHIMVRVGGGWQELSEFLRAKDPCRSKLNFNHTHHHHSAVSMSPLSYQHNNHHHGSQSIGQSSFSSSTVSRSRLPVADNSHQLLNASRPSAGGGGSSNGGLSRALIHGGANSSRHRFISGSASMSWISNNS